MERGIVAIAYLKTWLRLMGLPQGPVRAPQADLDGLGLPGAIRSAAATFAAPARAA